MYRFLKKCVLLLFVALMAAPPALAIDGEITDELRRISADFKAAELELKNAMEDAKKRLGTKDFEAVEKSHARWLEGADEEAKWLIDNLEASQERAYADTLLNRVAYLRDTVDNTLLRKSRRGLEGLYVSERGPQLQVWWPDIKKPVYRIVLITHNKDGLQERTEWNGQLSGSKIKLEAANNKPALEIHFAGAAAKLVSPREEKLVLQRK